MDKSSPSGKNPQRVGKSSLGAIGIVVLVGVYSLAQPALNARFGWNLPQLRSNDSGEVAVVSEANRDTKSSVRNGTSASAHESTSSSKPVDAGKSTQTKNDRGPLADRVRPQESTSGASSQANSEQANSEQADSEQAGDTELLYGLLREVSKDRYISPAGLQYTPGSAEGHRLEHLRRHTKDDPSRPGSHGVFDGDMEGALKTIDRAYLKAKEGTRTTKSVDDGRTIYTVDLGGRVGFVGGRDGGRKRNPMARRVRIVLEGTRVITAYPM
ncbi:hypothetical protein SH528x_000315 [Novipirellula sp. SH528]|uniref:hypothetical protein n=1 Tax=Novipirellula sp. SH528 TaxID=3454466 RepID=UPI003F9F0B92